jgi:hypothetical protein
MAGMEDVKRPGCNHPFHLYNPHAVVLAI